MGCWHLVLISLAIIGLAQSQRYQFRPSLARQQQQASEPTILYDENENGQVLVYRFPSAPPMANLIPVIGTLNPNPRLAPCSQLRDGIFPVLGNCSRFLECQQISPNRYRRLIKECPKGLWFRKDLRGCGPQTGVCPYGTLVPNPPATMMDSRAPGDRFNAPTTACVREGLFPLPGCHGYFSCRMTAQQGVFDRYTYQCPSGYRWNENAQDDFCVPEIQVRCSVPEEGSECIRPCKTGDVRTCRYTFIVEEFATMSMYCRQCPFVASDCDLPNCIPGGGVLKPVVAVNRRVPGPSIQACVNDILEIEVQNRLPAAAVTIHWHGLHQRESPHMDGVPYITQCPIHPGTTFRYRMKADISGTHLYHSHIGHQESDGLFGSMIIREPREAELGIGEKYDVDDPAHTMLIWHWFERAADVESLDTRLQRMRREGYGFIINGKGIAARVFNASGVRFTTPVEEFHVQTGRRYRFRSIFNTALNCPIQVSIDQHMLDIIAVDGRPVRPHTNLGLVDSVFLSAGERVDFVPTPHWNTNTSRRSYHIRVRGLNDCDDNKNAVHQYAMLRYDGDTSPLRGVTSYTNAIREGTAFNLNFDINMNNYFIQSRTLLAARDANLQADPLISGKPHKTYYINVGFNAFDESENIRVVFPQLNRLTWQSPSFPLLTQGESISDSTFCRPDMPRNCQNGLCRCTQVLEANLNELVEVVLVDPNGVGIGHPFHLHGFAFRVVSVGRYNTTFTDATVRQDNESGRIKKFFDGPLKDTAIVPSSGYLIFRFVAHNPGYWFFHCHISEHMAQGMALVFKIGKQGEMVKPPGNFPKCGNFF